jgi:hypothetical protein
MPPLHWNVLIWAGSLKELLMTGTRVRQHFCCLDCGEKEFDLTDMRQHALKVHGVKELKGKRELVLHLDGAGWYTSVYNWQIGDWKFTQTVRGAR